MKYVCADCGTETNQFNEPCDNCHNQRIVTIKFAETLLGTNWREIAFGTPVDSEPTKVV